MSERTIKLLHVEDDVLQQRLTAKMLTHVPEYQFAITNVGSEDAAVAEFGRARHEFIILDYHLEQGNGLSCLHKLREKDRIVPIVAISGAATPEIAAELLHVGADDYLSKQDLTAESLARIVRDALARADAWRRETAPTAGSPQHAQVAAKFESLCQDFMVRNSPELVARLDAFESAARSAGIGAGEMQELFDHVSRDAAARLLLRPLLLEVLLRLFGDTASAPEQGG